MVFIIYLQLTFSILNEINQENPKAAIIDELNMDPEFTLLANLEKEARNIASSIDVLTEHLVISLHTVSIHQLCYAFASILVNVYYSTDFCSDSRISNSLQGLCV